MTNCKGTSYISLLSNLRNIWKHSLLSRFKVRTAGPMAIFVSLRQSPFQLSFCHDLQSALNSNQNKADSLKTGHYILSVPQSVLKEAATRQKSDSMIIVLLWFWPRTVLQRVKTMFSYLHCHSVPKVRSGDSLYILTRSWGSDQLAKVNSTTFHYPTAQQFDNSAFASRMFLDTPHSPLKTNNNPVTGPGLIANLLPTFCCWRAGSPNCS